MMGLMGGEKIITVWLGWCFDNIPLFWVEIKPHHFRFTIINMAKDRHKGNVRMRTAKYIDRLTYDPSRHKRKEVRKRLQALQARQMEQHVPPDPKQVVKFGSININGLDLDSGWAVQELLKNKELDVSECLLLYLISL